MRMFKAAYPEAELTACDIDPAAVEFCAATFGATAIVSQRRPEEIDLPRRYELIWIGSLFTHLDAPRWPGFLHLLCQHLEPDGVLIFTTLGRTAADGVRFGIQPWAKTMPDVPSMLDTFERTGFSYQNYPNQEDYGSSLARPSWVCAQVELHPEIEISALTEGGWNGLQHMVVCRRRDYLAS